MLLVMLLPLVILSLSIPNGEKRHAGMFCLKMLSKNSFFLQFIFHLSLNIHQHLDNNIFCFCRSLRIKLTFWDSWASMWNDYSQKLIHSDVSLSYFNLVKSNTGMVSILFNLRCISLCVSSS